MKKTLSGAGGGRKTGGAQRGGKRWCEREEDAREDAGAADTGRGSTVVGQDRNAGAKKGRPQV